MKNLRDKINKGIDLIKREKLQEKFISFSYEGYKKFIREEKLNYFPDNFCGIPIICNPEQGAEVIVLTDPAYEFLYVG